MIVDAFFDAEFEGGRHERFRVNLVRRIEQIMRGIPASEEATAEADLDSLGKEGGDGSVQASRQVKRPPSCPGRKRWPDDVGRVSAPSILAAALPIWEATWSRAEKAGVDWLHIDIMDGVRARFPWAFR